MCRPDWSIGIESLLIVANPLMSKQKEDTSIAKEYLPLGSYGLRDSIQRIRQTKLLRRNTRSVGSGSQSLGQLFRREFGGRRHSAGRQVGDIR